MMPRTLFVGMFMAALVLLSVDAVAEQACDPPPTGDAKTDLQIAASQMALGQTDQAINAGSCRWPGPGTRRRSSRWDRRITTEAANLLIGIRLSGGTKRPVLVDTPVPATR
jgi:hypothetical protein